MNMKKLLTVIIFSALILAFILLAGYGFRAENEYEAQQMLRETNILDIKLSKGEISRAEYDLEYEYILEKYKYHGNNSMSLLRCRNAADKPG
jgi:uncharacterized membrane protein